MRHEKGLQAAERWSSHTGPSGEHRLRIDFDAVVPSYPMSLALEAKITDVNRQEWAARTTLLVHPSDVYVGLRPVRAFVRAGQTIELDVVAADIDGNAVPDSDVTVRSARIGWERKGEGAAEEKETDVDTCV